ncbi:MAG: hypothetical protein KAW19_06950, partial [Candidatus Aminicenantes bacterium]|nr:hypothetical protein [Candidatus Aminicenantes bacterium]
MYRRINLRITWVFVLFLGIILVSQATESEQKKALTFQDVMKFKEIRNPVISEDGLWVTYSSQPDRGDGEVVVYG